MPQLFDQIASDTDCTRHRVSLMTQPSREQSVLATISLFCLILHRVLLHCFPVSPSRVDLLCSRRVGPSSPCAYQYYEAMLNSSSYSFPSQPSEPNMAPQTTLDTLPAEIIHMILGHADCEAVLAVAGTNRVLKQTCVNNNIIFRNLVAHGNAVEMQKEEPIPPDEWSFLKIRDELRRHFNSPWAVPGLGVEADVVVWARWALADSKARKLAPTLLAWSRRAEHLADEFWQNPAFINWSFMASLDTTIRWLPLVIATRHPVTHAVPSEALFLASRKLYRDFSRCVKHPSAHETPVRSASALAVMDLCLLAQTLFTETPHRLVPVGEADLLWALHSRLMREPFRWSDAGPFRDFLQIIEQPFYKRWDRIADSPCPWSASTTRLSTVLYAHARANSAATAVAQFSRAKHRCALGAARDEKECLDPFFNGEYPPLPTETPLTELMPLPAPFSTHDSVGKQCIAMRHLGAMTDPSFLMDGRWTGHYFNASFNIPEVNSQRLCFSACEIHDLPPGDSDPSTAAPASTGAGTTRLPSSDESGVAPTIVKFAGHGHDTDGNFDFDGAMCHSSGWVQFQKRQRPESRRDWTGVMTPFGIVGVLGRGIWGHDRFQGWFWLWKEAWSKPWPDEE